MTTIVTHGLSWWRRCGDVAFQRFVGPAWVVDRETVLEAWRRVKLAALIAAVEAGCIVAVKSVSFTPYLLKKDLGIDDGSKLEGISKFASFMSSLSTPLLIALAAVAPLALMFGAGALMVGHRRAGAIIGGTVGALALAACATGLIN